MKPVDSIIFDYGGVIADHYVEPYQSQLGKILHTTQKETRELTSERTIHGKAYRLGKITKENFWNEIKRLSGREFDIELAHDLFVNTYMPNPAMISLIKYLKNEKGLQIGLALNEDADRWEVVKKAIKAEEISDVNVISCQIGFLKPDKEYYEEVLKMAKRTQDPSRILFVDDRKIHVDAAMAYGMQGHLFINSGDFATALYQMELVRFRE